uniref:Putative secreted peptide n=1 Tax=Anopheles braziliensis TaxID=58242 RepID=A0A2M3ZS24_9DIPT
MCGISWLLLALPTLPPMDEALLLALVVVPPVPVVPPVTDEPVPVPVPTEAFESSCPPVLAVPRRGCLVGGGRFLMSGPKRASRQGRKVRCSVWFPVAF